MTPIRKLRLVGRKWLLKVFSPGNDWARPCAAYAAAAQARDHKPLVLWAIISFASPCKCLIELSFVFTDTLLTFHSDNGHFLSEWNVGPATAWKAVVSRSQCDASQVNCTAQGFHLAALSIPALQFWATLRSEAVSCRGHFVELSGSRSPSPSTLSWRELRLRISLSSTWHPSKRYKESQTCLSQVPWAPSAPAGVAEALVVAGPASTLCELLLPLCHGSISLEHCLLGCPDLRLRVCLLVDQFQEVSLPERTSVAGWPCFHLL